MLAELFDPLAQAADVAELATAQDCPEQLPEETRPQYAARCLRFVLQGGSTGALTREQVEQADQAAQRQVCALPMVLTATDQVQNRVFGDLRHRFAKELDRRRANERAFCALLASCQRPDQDPDLGPDAAQAAQAEPQDDQAHAIRLLRAALVLVMQDGQQRPDGGSRSALIKPSPTRPPGGMANQAPSSF